jgi:hypothetical protein
MIRPDFREPAGAVFSPCGRFRHLLWRCWDASLPTLGLCCLNPSKAAADREDQSSRKFRGFAERLGCGSYITSNLYDWIATDPKDLKAAGYPVSDQNDSAIGIVAHLAQVFVCAWGAEARGLSRPAEVMKLVRGAGARPMALALTADGIPRHPLMLPYSCTPQPFGGKA